MHSHINIQANGIDIPVDEGFKLSIDDQNPLWNDNEMFSYPVQIPLDGARAIFKNIEDPDSDMRPTDFEHIPVQISVDGMPFRSGTAKMTDAEELSDAITMNVDAADHSLSDLIGNLKCRDIPVRESDHEALRIGEKIGNVKCTVKYQFAVKVDIKKASDPHYYTSEVRTVTGDFEPQALGFSFPGKCEVNDYTDHKAKLKETRVYNDNKKRTMPKVLVSYINVSQEYGAMVRTADDGSVVPALFANARVCYKHHGKESDGTTSSNLVDKLDDDKYEGKYPYWVLDADRPQSGICFYVLYFLDCLFDYLGVTFDKTALMAIPDMKRLVFFTTHCKYDTETLWGTSTSPKFSDSVSNPSSDGLKNLFSKVNDWLDSRGCGGTLSIEAEKTKSIQSFISGGNTYVVGQDDVRGIEVQNAITYASYSANLLAMFANNENFPEESVSTVLDSLQNQFGIRFHYDYEQRKVTAYLYRDVYRSAVTPIKFKGNLLSAHKVTEKITGVRVAYSAESSSTEQKEYLRYGRTDYDTDYDYIDYPQDRTITNQSYASIFQNVHCGNNNVYIDQLTGNAYRIKVSSDASSSDELQPVLFEVGAFKGVELGDCSELNSDFVQEFISDFQPIMFTDVNSRAELKLATGTISLVDDATKTAVDATLNKGQFQPILAAYIDEDMEHEFVKQKIQNALSDALADFYLTETLQLVESYNPSDTDDGNSPLQSYDWGLAIAVMRGGGTDATYQQYDFNYDGFNNARWRSVAGEYALSSDSIDNFANAFDYNGVQPGIGDKERFSLKIRAYKQPEWASSPLCNSSVAMRGTFDTFLSEHAYFLLNRKKYILQVEATAAQLVDIPNHWRELYDFDGVIGFINKVSYDISAEEGITQAQIELYSI